jgi:hypothetical protein
VEVLIVLVVTIVALGVVVQVTRAARLLHSREVRRAERASASLRVVEEIAHELGRAGLGLGDDIPPLLPRIGDSPTTDDRITIRSNPDGAMGALLDDVAPGLARVRVAGASLFEAGDRVVLSDTRGPPVAARVVAAQRDTLILEGRDRVEGRPPRTILARYGGRVRQVREVSYYPLPSADSPGLARRIDGGPPTTIVRGLERLRFTYRDEWGAEVAPRWLPRRGPRFISVELTLRPKGEVPPVRASVTLEPQTGTVPFDEVRVRMRLRRILFPVPGAVDVTSLPWAENGLVLFRRVNDRSEALSFILDRIPQDVRVESVIGLPSVPRPLALVPDVPVSAAAGSVWIAADGMEGLEIWRLLPDAHGGISVDSLLQRVLVAPGIRRVAGIEAGDPEGTFVAAERRSTSLVHVRPGESPRESRVERVSDLPGPPVGLARTHDGSFWTLVEPVRATEPEARLVTLPLDGDGRLGPARTAALLPGRPRSLAVDPVRGWLYALMLDRGDSVLYELSPVALAKPPVEIFRLSSWREEVQRDPSILGRAGAFSSTGSAEGEHAEGEHAEGAGGRPLLPPQLSAVAFDGRGSLFLIGEVSPMVLEFTLGRPWVARHRAGLAAAPILETPGKTRLRLVGWAQPTLVP